MARNPQFNHVKTTAGWMVSCPKGLAETGKRERHFFKTRDAARDYAANLKERMKSHGENATAIKPSLAEAAVMAEEILAPWGISLVEAARIAADFRRRETASRPLAEAGEAWLAACEGLRPRTVDSYRQLVARLGKNLGTRLLTSITATELQESIAPAGNSGASALGRIRTAGAFWRWSASEGWCDASTFDGVKSPNTHSAPIE